MEPREQFAEGDTLWLDLVISHVTCDKCFRDRSSSASLLTRQVSAVNEIIAANRKELKMNEWWWNGHALTTLESWMQWVNCNDAIAASIGLRSQGATFGHGEPRLWQPSYTLFFPTLPPCFLKLFLMRSFFGLFSHCIDLDLGYMLRWDRPLCLGDCECFQTVTQQAEVTCTSCLGFGSSFEARTDL